MGDEEPVKSFLRPTQVNIVREDLARANRVSTLPTLASIDADQAALVLSPRRPGQAIFPSASRSSTNHVEPAERFKTLRTQRANQFISQNLYMVPLFSRCSREFVDHMAEHVHVAFFYEGKILFNQGDIGDCMYILMRGEVEIIVNDVVVAHLDNGAVFGEAAAICKNADLAKRTASVRATTLCDCRTISRTNLLMTLSFFRADELIIQAETQRRLAELKARGALKKEREWWRMPPPRANDEGGPRQSVRHSSTVYNEMRKSKLSKVGIVRSTLPKAPPGSNEKSAFSLTTTREDSDEENEDTFDMQSVLEPAECSSSCRDAAQIIQEGYNAELPLADGFELCSNIAAVPPMGLPALVPDGQPPDDATRAGDSSSRIAPRGPLQLDSSLSRGDSRRSKSKTVDAVTQREQDEPRRRASESATPRSVEHLNVYLMPTWQINQRSSTSKKPDGDLLLTALGKMSARDFARPSAEPGPLPSEQETLCSPHPETASLHSTSSAAQARALRKAESGAVRVASGSPPWSQSGEAALQWGEARFLQSTSASARRKHNPGNLRTVARRQQNCRAKKAGGYTADV